MKIATLPLPTPEKSDFPLSQQPPSKIWGPVKPPLPFLKIWLKVQPLPPSQYKGGGGIFGITNLIYFRDTWKMHLLGSGKISFSMAIWRKCLEHSVVFPVNLFWRNLHLMFLLLPFSWNSRVWSFFSSILGIETFFWKVLKFFA